MSYEKVSKMSGYLEKRGKMSILGRWKKWWCVLEGQLLLYYKSRIDYKNLSPCCGSLNMALVRNIQPNLGYQIHIRAKNKERQQQWFYALINVLPQNAYQSPIFNTFSVIPLETTRRTKHQRRKINFISTSKKKHLTTANYLSIKCCNLDISQCVTTVMKPRENETAHMLPPAIKNAQPETGTTKTRSLEQVPSNETTTQPSLVVHTKTTNKFTSGANIRRFSSYQNIARDELLKEEQQLYHRSVSCDCVFTDYTISFVELQRLRTHESSRRNPPLTQERDQYFGDVEQRNGGGNQFTKRIKNHAKKKKNISKRSFSFLKKLLVKRNKENLTEEHEKKDIHVEVEEVNTEPEAIYLEIAEESMEPNNTSPTNEMDSILILSTARNSDAVTIECVSTDDTFDVTNVANADECEILNDTRTNENEEPIFEPHLPELPQKNKNCLSTNDDPVLPSIESIRPTENKYVVNLASVTVNTTKELDLLLLELSSINKSETEKGTESFQFNNTVIDDPDYDIPRPHRSLLNESILETESESKDKSACTSISNEKFLDSLSVDIAPDSLEMPWLLSNRSCTVNYWASKNNFNLSLDSESESENEFHDSLNSPSLIRSKKMCVEKTYIV